MSNKKLLEKALDNATPENEAVSCFLMLRKKKVKSDEFVAQSENPELSFLVNQLKHLSQVKISEANRRANAWKKISILLFILQIIVLILI